jgi:hypothetical protein
MRFVKLGVLALAAFALSACGTLNGLAGGSSEPSVSPRWAVLKAAETIEPVLDEVTVLIATGIVSDNVADDIAEHGPIIQRIVGAYFDGAEACIVAGGQLETEVAAGRQCERSTLLALYESLDGEIIAWMIDASARGEQATAATIGAARLVVSLVPKPVAGGPFPGYRDEPDVPLDLFQARRAVLKAKFETMLAAAAARAARLTAAPAAASS